jgi:hypothetical protein
MLQTNLLRLHPLLLVAALGIAPSFVNQDGAIDLLDVAPFVDSIGMTAYVCEADVNQDGSNDLLDVAPFVDLLAGG